MLGSTSTRTARAYATHADEAPAYWMIGVLWRVLATGVQTGNSLCLLDQLCSPGAGPTCHEHDQDEGLYVVSGSCTFNAGGTEFKAGPGSFVAVPRRTEHSFIVEDEAVLINFYLPAGFELFIMGSAVPAERKSLPPADAPHPPLWLLQRLSADYGGLPPTPKRDTSPNPDSPAQPRLSSARKADRYLYRGGRWSVLADAASTGGSYCAFEVEVPNGCLRPPRIRADVDEVFYLLDGEVDFLVGDRTLRARQGSLVFVPRSTVSAWRVESGTARVLNVQTHPGYERLVRCLGEPTTEAGAPTPGRTDVSEARLRSLHAELGIHDVEVPARFRHAS